ncbi:MAG TPA: bile acid:sodium symporter [Bacteroidales bacterium]|jgi:BASS family bile acid:Na+ symporter|nr:bile acid:sodium symporter [Bacteroidales bacterium]
MKISAFIEKHFWIVLLAGIILALWIPMPFRVPHFVPRLILGMMLFLVFLKIDAIEILENMRNYKLMIYVTFIYMFAIPLFFYFLMKIFDPELAIGMLLLTSMPAGVSTPALTDIVKGNISLSMSLVITSQLIAPLTVPLLFWIFVGNSLEINKLLLLKDIAILVFVPLITSQLAKKFFPLAIKRTQHLFTSANVFLLFSFVYVAMSSQRDIIMQNPAGLIWQVAVIYLVFIILHFIGYFICWRDKKENRIAVAIGAAYMNNGMAIVLAVSYFSPAILVLMVLSELPWNTLLAPFKKVTERL